MRIDEPLDPLMQFSQLIACALLSDAKFRFVVNQLAGAKDGDQQVLVAHFRAECFAPRGIGDIDNRTWLADSQSLVVDRITEKAIAIQEPPDLRNAWRGDLRCLLGELDLVIPFSRRIAQSREFVDAA